MAVVASATIAGLIAIGSATGVLPSKRFAVQGDEALPRVETKPVQPGACALCGTIESVRTVEVYDEPSAAGAVTDSKGGATSVLESLNDIVSGSATGKAENARKRLVWRVTVRMDDGSFRAISLPSAPAFAVGEKVRVVDGRLARA